MSKTHIIDLQIVNRSAFNLTYVGDWFDHGGLAEGNSWPPTISANSAAPIVECCEGYGSLLGCSGWVHYTANGQDVYMSFSNPEVGDNKIDIGNSGSVWDDMASHYGYPVTRAFPLTGTNWLVAYIESTPGDRNTASYTIEGVDTSVITDGSTQLVNVASAFANIPTTPSYRKYYKCDDYPTPLAGLIESHFKGIASYRDKFVFSHTDLDPLSPQQNGKWIVADDLPGPGQAETEGTFDTLHPGWPHPCASQACGSFMAQGIQASASGSGAGVSEIEILDIRMTAVNRPPSLLGVIPRKGDGINGVGMTKEAGAEGRYIVGAINGGSLTFYRSQSPSLITNGRPTVAFDQILHEDGFPESGAGLAMVTQRDGGIFVITLNADNDGSNSKACLYQLSIPPSPEQPSIEKIDCVDLPVTDVSNSVQTALSYLKFLPEAVRDLIDKLGFEYLNSSFRWGKGLAVTSEDTLELYASDRNVLPLSSIPLIGSDQDFSVLVWASGNPEAEVS